MYEELLKKLRTRSSIRRGLRGPLQIDRIAAVLDEAADAIEEQAKKISDLQSALDVALEDIVATERHLYEYRAGEDG